MTVERMKPDTDERTLVLARCVFELTQRFNCISNPEEIFVAVADGLDALVGPDRLAIVLFRNNGSDVDMRFSRGEPLEFRSEPPVDLAGNKRLFELMQPLLYDITEPPRFAGDVDRYEQGYRHGAIAPLVIDRETLGLFTMMSKREGFFSESDLWILSSLAGALGIMLAATNLRYESERGRIEAEFVAEMGLLVSSVRDEDELIRQFVDLATSQFGCPAAIYLLRHDRLHLGAISVPPGLDTAAVTLMATTMTEFADNPVTQALSIDPFGGPIVAAFDRESDLALSPVLVDELRRRDVSSILAMPIVWNGRPFGVIAISQNNRVRESAPIPWERQPKLLARLAHHLAPALENVKLHDDLTRALNESEVLRRIISDTSRRENPLEGLTILARAAQMLYGADYVGIARVVTEECRWLVNVGSRRSDQEIELTTPPNARLWAAIDRLTPILVRDFPHDPPVIASEFPLHVEERIRSSLIVPFDIDDTSKGLFMIGYRRSHSFDAADIRFARSLGGSVAASLLREQDQ